MQNYLGPLSTYKFVVIAFDESAVKPDFGACYALDSITDTYKIWNEVIENEWFSENCGADDENWMENHEAWTEVPRS